MGKTKKINRRIVLASCHVGAPKAFIGMLEGPNFGKLVVRVNDEH